MSLTFLVNALICEHSFVVVIVSLCAVAAFKSETFNQMQCNEQTFACTVSVQIVTSTRTCSYLSKRTKNI